MSYQVLARKWRPATFADLVGQEHVVTALTNSLARGRLHHAYLLTGTRGVGKTTIARILAKCLNCVTGLTPTPCGVCDACRDIDAGRFVDLLELDAASHTGIDNMREILDNARYAPTVGRYKVYLIDEVHMLSKAAFNSMLKTLEEPPEHVRFVLATTDPQKIPVTVLSRCLQFNLKPLAPPVIAARLDYILAQEDIAHDAAAVDLIARAAQGSLRDGLSLLDQAIAFGSGEVKDDAVRTMLGTVDRQYVYRIADALADDDGPALLAESDALAERGLSSSQALEELASLFHRVAVAQVVPEAVKAFDDADRLAGYAARFSAETVQLYYQIAAQGRADLEIAPDEATGVAMTLLRMLAFSPDKAATPERATRVERAAPPAASTLIAPDDHARLERGVDRARRCHQAREPAMPATPREVVPLPDDSAAWPAFVAQLKLTGMAAQLAAQTELKSLTGNALTLALPAAFKHLADKAYSDKLKGALEHATGRKLLLAFEVGAPRGYVACRHREARARGGERQAGGRVSRRALRARLADQVRRPGAQRFDQTLERSQRVKEITR